jgi:hypothetical protein
MSILKTLKLVRRRFEAGRYETGHWIPGTAYTDTVFRGTCSPLDGQIVQLLPEGLRDKEGIRVVSSLAIDWIIGDPEKHLTGDLIGYHNSWYRIFKAQRTDNHLLAHWTVIALKEPYHDPA